MAVAVLIDLPEFTAELYDAVFKDMNLGSSPPEHALFHAARPHEGCWRIVAVWENREAFGQFSRDQITPLLQKHGASGTPNIVMWDVHNILK